MNRLFTKFFLLCGLLAAPAFGFAQDVIFNNSGEEIKSKVIEIDDQKVKYRKFDNLEGPIYNIPKSQVLLIRYQNGSIEVFKKEEEAPQKAVATPVTPRVEPQPAAPQPAAPQPAPNFNNVISAPAASTPAYSSGTSTRNGRFYLAYSPGTFAPIGISMGGLTDGGGFIFSVRLSSSALGETSIYDMSDADGMSDDYWNWKYTGENEYRRGAFTVAYASKLAGNIDGTSLHWYGGVGYGFANYYYVYEQIGPGTGTSYGNEYIKYTDVSKESVEFEAGAILDMNGFNLNVGYTTCGFAEPMITFGIGLGL